jgi:colanic acid/amylovoran biosynthesis glycosyltransferase
MRKAAHYSHSYLALTKTWLYAQIINLKRFEPIVLCRRTENLDQFPIKNIFSFDSLSRLRKAYYMRGASQDYYDQYFKRVLRKERPVLIHAHFGPHGCYVMPIAKKFELPLVTSFYGFDATRLVETEREWLEKYKILFEEGNLFLAEGSHMAKTLQNLGCPRSKTAIFRLGVDLVRLPYRKREMKETIRLLAAGTFREKKGHTYTVEAFGMLAERYRNISLTIIGDANDHDPHEMKEKKKILETIKSLNLDGRVRLPGYVPYEALIHEFYEHDIFVSPSVHAADGDAEGGAPVTVIEASATGMPVVSTLHCDIPEVVADGVSGFLVAERDSEALAEKLDHLCSNPDLRARMGEAGRRRVEENYDINKQVPKLETLYETVIAGGMGR